MGRFRIQFVVLMVTLGIVAQAVAESLPDPTPVTLRLRSAPAREAYESLAKQSAVRIAYTWRPPAEDCRVSLNLVHEPFWQAVAQVGKSAGMEIDWVRRVPSAEIGLIPASYQRDRQVVGAATDGAFIAGLYDLTSDQDFRAANDPTRLVASRLNIKLWAEPKLRGLYWHSISVEQLIDESGRPIEYKPVAKSILFQDGLGYIILDLAERPWPRRIGKLVLKSKVVTAVKSDVAEITDFSQDQPGAIDAGGFRIERHSHEIASGRDVTLNLSPLGNSSPQWTRLPGSISLFEPFAVDRSGKRLNLSVQRQLAGRNFRIQLQATGKPDKLYLDLPTEIADYDVKLEFADVKLH